MRLLPLLAALPLLLAAGCTRLAGTAYDAATHRPLSDAVFTIGHPGGVGVFDRKSTDVNGHFDFSISPTDESHVYGYNAKNDPASAQRIDRAEFSDHMKVYVGTGARDDFAPHDQ